VKGACGLARTAKTAHEAVEEACGGLDNSGNPALLYGIGFPRVVERLCRTQGRETGEGRSHLAELLNYQHDAGHV
jgi:hypothetical protein